MKRLVSITRRAKQKSMQSIIRHKANFITKFRSYAHNFESFVNLHQANHQGEKGVGMKIQMKFLQRLHEKAQELREGLGRSVKMSGRTKTIHFWWDWQLKKPLWSGFNRLANPSTPWKPTGCWRDHCAWKNSRGKTTTTMCIALNTQPSRSPTALSWWVLLSLAPVEEKP